MGTFDPEIIYTLNSLFKNPYTWIRIIIALLTSDSRTYLMPVASDYIISARNDPYEI